MKVRSGPVAGASFTHGDFRLTRLDQAATPARVFSPGHYGLANLAPPTRRGTSLSLGQMFLIASPLFLVAAVLLRIRANRPARTAP